jgi:hypothetical protein
MVPTKLSGWTLESIRALLEAKVFENDSFDFKEDLPDRRNDEGKLNLAIDCAAFANARGGFLVFGIKNDMSLTAADRLVGVSSGDFPAQFGDFPRKCYPSVDWQFSSSGLALASGRLLHVVEVPKSWKAPHSVELPGQQGTFRFPKRTNKGNEYMPITEVQAMFLNLQERRRKLDLLGSELDFALRLALEVVEPDKRMDSEVDLVTFDLTILNNVVGELYVMLTAMPDLIQSIYAVRKQAGIINRIVQEYPVRVALPGSLPVALGRNTNAHLYQEAGTLAASIRKARAELKRFVEQI